MFQATHSLKDCLTRGRSPIHPITSDLIMQLFLYLISRYFSQGRGKLLGGKNSGGWANDSSIRNYEFSDDFGDM